MVQSKALLSGTLLVTFLSGSFVGYVGGGEPSATAPGSQSVEVLYRDQFDRLRDRGYSAEEMAEAREIYEDYLEGYRLWWNEFLESHQQNLDPLDDRFYDRMDALEASFRERTGLPAQDPDAADEDPR